MACLSYSGTGIWCTRRIWISGNLWLVKLSASLLHIIAIRKSMVLLEICLVTVVVLRHNETRINVDDAHASLSRSVDDNPFSDIFIFSCRYVQYKLSHCP